MDIQPEMIASVLSYVKRRLAPQPVKIRADIEVTCFDYEGIDAIKEVKPFFINYICA
jgi:translation initiation factor 2 subunit 1